MIMLGIMLLVLAIVGLLIAYNTGRTPISTWRWLPPTREERPQLFADFVSINIGLVVAGCLLILIGLIT